MARNNRIFYSVIFAITCPLVLAAGLVSERERLVFIILSLLLFAFHFFKLSVLLNFTLFLSLFFSAFLNSRFIFFGKLDFLFFQAVILGIFFVLKMRVLKTFSSQCNANLLVLHARGLLKAPHPGNFSLGIICMLIVTFLLQFFINRILLGFYLNFWIDLKHSWPVFLFCITYFLMDPVRSKMPEAFAAPLVWTSNGMKNSRTSWVSYFIGLFILTTFLSYLGPVKKEDIVTKKVEHNLAFFYKDRENWKNMSSPFRRGLVYEYLGLWQNARDEFKKLLILSPGDIEAHFNLAQSYAAEKLWYEAMLEYEKVVGLDPNYCGSHYGLAVVYKALGEIEKAKKEYLKEIEVNPKEIKAYIALEELYRREGKAEEMAMVRSRRLGEITASIDGKDISDDNLRIIPVVLNGGAVTVEIVARGTYAQGFWPRVEVWMSAAGSLMKGRDAWIKSDAWKSYYFNFATLPGEEKIIIHFTNDFFGGSDNDRNFYIKRINFIYGR